MKLKECGGCSERSAMFASSKASAWASENLLGISTRWLQGFVAGRWEYLRDKKATQFGRNNPVQRRNCWLERIMTSSANTVAMDASMAVVVWCRKRASSRKNNLWSTAGAECTGKTSKYVHSLELEQTITALWNSKKYHLSITSYTHAGSTWNCTWWHLLGITTLTVQMPAANMGIHHSRIPGNQRNSI